MSLRPNISEKMSAFPCEAFEFGRLSAGDQISRVSDFMSEVCPGVLLEGPAPRPVGTASVSQVLRELPAQTQGHLLASLGSHYRQRLFLGVMRNKTVADDTDLFATPNEMPDGMLMRRYQQERERNSRVSALLGAELTARKDMANIAGNGVDLAWTENSFSNLRIESYQNSETWTITGVYKKDGSGPSHEFRYSALPQEYWQELVFDGRLVIPAGEQDRLFHEKVFAGARKASLKSPKPDSKNPIPEDFGPLSFHRTEIFYGTRKVLKLDPERGNSGGILGFLKGREETVSDDKPQRKYFLTASGDRLVVINWNEITDLLSIDVFVGHDQLPSPELSCAIDDKRARGLLPIVRTLKGETKEEGRRLGELIKKLEAVASFQCL